MEFYPALLIRLVAEGRLDPAARFPVALVARLLPRQANVFAFLIDKSARTLRPWMDAAGERMEAQGSGA